MKNVFIITIIVFLSFKAKETKVTAADVAIVEIAKIIDANPEEPIKHTFYEETVKPGETNQNSGYINSTLYKGTLNGTIKITLYLTEHENPCGGNVTFFNAMYKYDNQEKWILLNVNTDRDKKNYCMVEDNFTGALFLEKNENNISGHWISPNSKKQYKIKLENQLLDLKFAKDHTIIEQLDDILFDDLIYNANDC